MQQNFHPKLTVNKKDWIKINTFLLKVKILRVVLVLQKKNAIQDSNIQVKEGNK